MGCVGVWNWVLLVLVITEHAKATCGDSSFPRRVPVETILGWFVSLSTGLTCNVQSFLQVEQNS